MEGCLKIHLLCVTGYITGMGPYNFLAKCLNEVNKSFFYAFALAFTKLTHRSTSSRITKDRQGRQSLLFSRRDSVTELFLVSILKFLYPWGGQPLVHFFKSHFPYKGFVKLLLFSRHPSISRTLSFMPVFHVTRSFTFLSVFISQNLFKTKNGLRFALDHVLYCNNAVP